MSRSVRQGFDQVVPPTDDTSVRDHHGTDGYSESACLRSFRQLLGTTPIQYVKQYRIEKDAGLLLTTRLRTGEIGAECGFNDLSYFTKTRLLFSTTIYQ